jgi:dTDP-4-dehydrorhamnose 3,5-epimerase
MKSDIPGVYFFPLNKFEDERGFLTELFRNDELEPENQPVMAYLSETKPGVVRGPHEHLNQCDLFCFVGPGNFDLYLWEKDDKKNEIHESLGENNRWAVTVPPGVVHGYKCVSEKPGMVINCASTLYKGAGKKYPVDEIRHEQDPNSPYKIL